MLPKTLSEPALFKDSPKKPIHKSTIASREWPGAPVVSRYLRSRSSWTLVLAKTRLRRRRIQLAIVYQLGMKARQVFQMQQACTIQIPPLAWTAQTAVSEVAPLLALEGSLLTYRHAIIDIYAQTGILHRMLVGAVDKSSDVDEREDVSLGSAWRALQARCRR